MTDTVREVTGPQVDVPQSVQRPGAGGTVQSRVVQTEVGVVKTPLTVAIGADVPLVASGAWA